MSQNINEPIDPGSPIGDRPGTPGKSGILFASQVRDATGASGGSASGVYTSSEHYNRSAKGVRLNLVIAPTGAATGTVSLVIQVPDPVSDSSSGTVWTDLVGTLTNTATGPLGVNGTGALTGAIMTIYPGLSGIADASGASGVGTVINQHLGPRWRAKVTVTNAPLTFTVGADYLM